MKSALTPFLLVSLLLAPLPFVSAQEANRGRANRSASATNKVEPYDLRLEHLTAPQGIDELKPRFSWKLRSSENGQSQSAYQITVQKTSSGKAAEVWNSGKVQGTAQFVEYAGTPLESQTDYSWTVTVYDKSDKAQSATSSFSTGILTPDGWKGQWIGLNQFSQEADDTKTDMTLDGAVWIWTSADGIDQGALGKTTFRKTFELPDQRILKAELAATADNNLIAHLNDKEVARAMNFKTAQVFDLKGAVQPGKNVLIIEVDNHGDAPNPAGLIGTLRVVYATSNVVEMKTDATWEGTPGARKDAADWKPAVKLADLGGGPWGEIAIDNPRKSAPARYLATNFSIKETPVSAKAYIAGLGYYELAINGKKVGD
ncbi:MAG: hypothetical protein LBI05_03230, partial [Planctomycetaceae bacterium]|nr:hypothetical protein [Planctomycetaceae bacterium]